MCQLTAIYVLATPEAPETTPKVAACRKVCESQGWPIGRTIRERDTARPKLAGLAAAAERGEMARVVFFDWDAMAAGPGIEDWHACVYRIHRAGVRVSLATA
ncbi:MAG: hypothetical protein R2853_21070 [Thermomicrobiales bacterium]